MNFIFIFGPQAVGKMTVGQEVAKRTGHRFLHNHLTIDVAKALFDVRDVAYIKFLMRLNLNIFNEFIKNSNSLGLIYTDVWMLNRKYDLQAKSKMFELFDKNGWNVYVVELTASLETRINRNKTENRVINKPSKSDWNTTEEQLLWSEEHHVLNSFKAVDFQLPSFVKNHLLINNESLSVEEAAGIIIKETCNCGC